MVTVASPKTKKAGGLIIITLHDQSSSELHTNASALSLLSSQTHLLAFHVCRLCVAALQWASQRSWSDQQLPHSYPASVCLWEKTGSVSINIHSQNWIKYQLTSVQIQQDGCSLGSISSYHRNARLLWVVARVFCEGALKYLLETPP